MAKKISKHSRAARRNEIEEHDAKELKNLPRLEKTDVSSAIIRATVKKNEDLLRNKQEKKERTRISKKSKTPSVNLSKDKLEKAISLSDRLEIKILKSKQKARMVQTARKANWDTINSLAKKDLEDKESSEATKEEEKEEEADAMEEDVELFGDDDENEEQQEENSSRVKKNVFALLEEVEA